MKTIGFIPARLGSSRFPRKVLADISGKTMLQRVYEGSQVSCIDQMYITTCDEEIADHANDIGANVIMTSKEHSRCLDRVAEAYSKLDENNPETNIICIQGDEPLVDNQIVTDFVKKFKSNKYKFAVSSVQINSSEEFLDPDIVKIIWNEAMRTVYTSRAPIPYLKEFQRDKAWKIFGMFGFKPDILKVFNTIKQSKLEIIESCDTNRICGMSTIEQYVIPFKTSKCYQSIDNVSNVDLVTSIINQK